MFQHTYPHLCQPIQLGKTLFKNRIFSAPMGGTDITWDCCIGPKSTKFYELRAKGGAGAVTISECMVHPKTDGSHAFHLDLSVPGSLPSFTYTADAIRRHGAIPSVELSHSGQFAGTYMADKSKQHGLTQWGPSATVRADGVEVGELTHDMIDDIVASYGRVAGLAKRAGFEMVMVHGGHGWLINQFLSPLFNHRSDEYGGDLENRVRLAREILTSIRNTVGPFFPIEFRMSGSEFVEGGYDLDEGVRIAQSIEDLVDLVHVSAGTYQKTFGITHPSMFEAHGRNVFLAEEIKKHISKPVATIGGLDDPEQMEQIIASGQADVVEMARGLLADPEFPNKVMQNRDSEIVHCLRCFTCMAERATTFTRRCTVNPLIGREDEGLGELNRAPIAKKLVVAGGGPGGLYAAYTAARRGHRVVLFEKQSELGGILKGERALSFKYEMYQLGLTYALLAKKAGVDIRLNTAATEASVTNENPDVLIVAIGANPLVPPIPGLADPAVIGVTELYLRKDEVKDEVVVFGGGLAGCEAAVEFGREGKKVHIVEMRDTLCPDANIRHRPLLLAELKRLGVDIRCGLRGTQVTNQGIHCKDKDGHEILVLGKTVICALGLRPKSSEAKAMLDWAPEVHMIGDCVRVSTITNAVYQGYHAALDIE